MDFLSNYNSKQKIYKEQLQEISGISFTLREIDIIACILHNRGEKKIASVLFISPRTVSAHVHNIMLKLGHSSRDNVIDFIEKSGKLQFAKKYYLHLLIFASFEQQLQRIGKTINRSTIICSIDYRKVSNEIQQLLHSLKTHLKLANVILIEEKSNFENVKCNLCILSDNFSLLQAKSEQIFLKMDNTIELSEKDSIQHIDFSLEENYYFSTFSLLSQIINSSELEQIIQAFNSEFQAIKNSWENNNNGESTIVNNISQVIYKNKTTTILAISIILLAIILVAAIPIYDREKEHKVMLAHSDLIMPIQSTVITRSELINKIDDHFKKKEEIQTIAIIGAGGAGKTTLARQYAHLQTSNVIWEINAENMESLQKSFLNLAEKLVQTEKEEKILDDIKLIKTPEERKEKIIFFVKNNLLLKPNWFLIYDNVESFTDIQEYLPQDAATWGIGRILLTTRDSNISTNKRVNYTIDIGELTQDQKLTLFTKIMKDKELDTASIKNFLMFIPSFPLDVSIAAYYLKSTDTSFDKYLENINQINTDFENIQFSLLKEAGDYTNTRYKIISISLQHLIELHKDFQDLLLFISILDSQNIPRELLEQYKNNVVVDSFIYHLKKYSLIAHDSSSLFGVVFSLHRSTQAITLSYLTKKLNLERDKQFLKPIANIESYIAAFVDQEDSLKMRLLLNHCETLLSHSNLLSEKMNNSITTLLGIIYYYLGSEFQAKQILEKNLIEFKDYQDKNSIRYARVLVYLGIVNRRTGDYNKAKELLEQSVIIYKKHSSDDLGYALALGRLGNIYRLLGNYDKAKNLLEQSIVIYNKHPEKYIIGVARSIAHLGMLYYTLGNYDKAKDLLEQSIVIYQKYYPQDNIDTAWVLTPLGMTYKALGDYKKAKNLLQQSLIIHERHFGKDHIQTAWALAPLGMTYNALGDYKKAKNLLQQSLIIHEKRYGKDHIQTAWILNTFGELYLSKDNLSSAENIIMLSLEIFKKNNHPESYLSLELLGDLFIKKADIAMKNRDIAKFQVLYEQAINYLKQALEITKINFPANSSHITRLTLKFQNTTKFYYEVIDSKVRNEVVGVSATSL